MEVIGNCLGPQRLRRIQRTLHNFKVTILCLFLTVVVLRGTIGPGNFATPDQDFVDLRNRLLVENRTTSSRGGMGKPYRLGSVISDWDERRRKWLKNNRGFPNFIRPGKPRVLLVTGSSPEQCENPIGDHYLLKSIKNKIDYCRLHGIEIFYNLAVLDEEMTGFWGKLPLIRKLLLSHPEVEFIWWMDSDAMFTDMLFKIPWDRYREFNFIMHGWKEMVYDQRSWVGLNTGSFLLRNCQWSIDILDTWAPMGPKGKTRDEAGKLLTKELKDRPIFEADDQSAMVYLLATQREKWGNKIYLENSYNLHGYWGILVDKFEEMVAENRPLVTHFVGCKPCGKAGDYPVERCLKAMERAFNFGDNQILEMYGFAHKSLMSRRVERIRDVNENEGEMKNEVGLMEPVLSPAMEVEPPSSSSSSSSSSPKGNLSFHI